VKTPVLDVDYCVTCLCPKKQQQFLVVNYGLSRPYDGSILPLYNTILLWVVRNSELPLDSYLLTKTLELLRGILTPIVQFQDFDLLPYLVFNKSFEILNSIRDFILGL
jgi:hypothetical protein